MILPYSTEQVWELLQTEQRNPTIIDIKASYDNLNKNLVVYISNLSLDVIMHNVDKLSKEEKFDILLQYILSTKCHNIKALSYAFVQVLYCVTDNVIEIGDSFLTTTEAIEFANKYKDIVQKNFDFLKSAFVVYTAKELFADGKIAENPKEVFENVDMRNACSLNIVHLFAIGETMGLLANCDESEDNLKYYVKQFEEAVFSGKRLAEYYFVKENFLAMMTMVDIVDATNSTDNESL